MYLQSCCASKAFDVWEWISGPSCKKEEVWEIGPECAVLSQNVFIWFATVPAIFYWQHSWKSRNIGLWGISPLLLFKGANVLFHSFVQLQSILLPCLFIWLTRVLGCALCTLGFLQYLQRRNALEWKLHSIPRDRSWGTATHWNITLGVHVLILMRNGDSLIYTIFVCKVQSFRVREQEYEQKYYF